MKRLLPLLPLLTLTGCQIRDDITVTFVIAVAFCVCLGIAACLAAEV